MHPLMQSRGGPPRGGQVKKCPVCGKEFYRKPSDAQERHCSLACRRSVKPQSVKEKNARHYAAHRNKINEHHAKYRAENKPALLIAWRRSGAKYRASHASAEAARVSRYQAIHKDRLYEANWGRHLVKKYKISAADYEAMLKKQGGVCLICGRPPKRFRLHVDHRHSDGLVRGLLCSQCNQTVVVALERFSERMPRALLYLDGRLDGPPERPIGSE